MKRRALIILLGILAIAAAACSDHGARDDAGVYPSISGAPVTKAEIAAVLWGTEEEPSATAKCIAGSHFKIEKDNGFDIMRKPDPAVRFSRRVVIASAINVFMTDPTSDGRGIDCPSEGALGYAVASSVSDPIEIDVAEEIAARQNLYNIARTAGASYPKCQITVYFDKGEVPSRCAIPVTPSEPACGTEGEACCGKFPAQTCDADLTCNADDICVASEEEPTEADCGGKGEPCCGTAPNQTCTGGLSCNGGTCGIKVVQIPWGRIDPSDFPKVLAQRIDTTEATDAKVADAVVPGTEGFSDFSCTEEERYPIKLVVDGIDCRIRLQPGQQAPWDTRDTSENQIGGAYQQ